jgi:hypothetical protein
MTRSAEERIDDLRGQDSLLLFPSRQPCPLDSFEPNTILSLVDDLPHVRRLDSRHGTVRRLHPLVVVVASRKA